MHIRLLLPSFSLITLLILSACSYEQKGDDTNSTDPAVSKPALTENILFARADTAELRLNIAIPANPEEKHPLLIFIHGGGWQTGHRTAYNTQIQNAAERGFVAATISHRYTRTVDSNGEPVYRWPDPLLDVKSAVRFLRAHAGTYHIDPGRIGVLGASSGAHLAMMLAFPGPESEFEGSLDVPGDEEQTQPTTVHAVANLSGPTEMVSAYSAPVITPFLDALMNGGPDEHPAQYRMASPIHHLSPDDPPILTIHGRLDEVVPVEQALILDSEMKKHGLNHRLVILEDQGHIFEGEAAERSWEMVYLFFKETLI